MNIWKKMLTALLAVLLLISIAPAVLAAESTDSVSEIRLSAQTDYSELELQLAIAGGLKSYDYTAQSWAPLKKAMDTGTRYVNGKYGQRAVNEAVDAIKKAMTGLVKMDYSALESVLTEVYARIDDNPELHDVWTRLDAAEAEARPLLVSGNQEAVDAAVAELRALLEELSACSYVEKETEVVIQEVEVEVLPTGDYCNISMHRIWPVLFAASAAMNVALLIVLTYVIVKKRNTHDNTPLVSYDIDDDIDF